jgi:plasmid stabilization system protein ParE
MRYTVTWLPAAQDELANIWNQAADRQAVTNAANRIDRTLLWNAEQKGRPDNGRRILIDLPLAVTFTVSPDDRLVRVVWVERV